MKFSLHMYDVFSLLQSKNLMGSTNPSLKIDGFGRTHRTNANATAEAYSLDNETYSTQLINEPFSKGHKSV